jgi:hypothetical protein
VRELVSGGGPPAAYFSSRAVVVCGGGVSRSGFPNGNEGGAREEEGGVAADLRQARACGVHGVPTR